MPSGSHGGSRGSHSSGGSRSSFGGGRSSFGGSHHRHHGNTIFMHHGHPRRFRWGHRYYIYSSGSQSILTLFMALLGFAFFFIFMQGVTLSAYKDDLVLIEEDYYYYQDMISYAEAHRDEGYIVDATVTGKFYNDDAEKYYITYKIRTDSGLWLKGYTYSCYTLAQASNFRVNTTIEVAVDSVPITSSTDSITLDYKNMSLENDGEYVNTKNKIKSLRTTIGITVAIGLAILAGAILYAYKKKELAEEKEAKEEKEKEEARELNSTTTQCAYCGATYSKSEKKCHCCGATLRK